MHDFNRLKNFVDDLMTRLTFPPDARETLLDALDRIAGDRVAAAWFSRLLSRYDESVNCEYWQMLDDVTALGGTLGIHEYTAALLLFLCLAERLRVRYSERGLDEGIYYNSMMDLRYKLEECRLVHGVNGSFVAAWFPGFFELTRFALGRLQFEIVRTNADREVGGVMLPAGSRAINVHIPRTGTRLDRREVLEAYRLAAEMFAEEFTAQPVVFTCESWLLDPWIITALSPESNLAAFYRDFKVVETENFEGYGELWRLFDCTVSEDTSALPKDSSLRRAYAARIDSGEPIAWGLGLFVYRDGCILND